MCMCVSVWIGCMRVPESYNRTLDALEVNLQAVVTLGCGRWEFNSRLVSKCCRVISLAPSVNTHEHYVLLHVLVVWLLKLAFRSVLWLVCFPTTELSG